MEITGQIVVMLDCETLALPAGRKSLNSIRSYLESQALSKQRILAEFIVDGTPQDLSLPLEQQSFSRVEAVTISLEELPLLLLNTAGRQVARAQASVEATLTLVLINNPNTAHELWWNLAGQLKEPVLTLSLMPENICQLCSGVSFERLRRWQLQQLAIIVRRVDAACDSGDNILLSDALEKTVLPWLTSLGQQIELWHETALAALRLGIKRAVP
jgi:hypothetical protein